MPAADASSDSQADVAARRLIGHVFACEDELAAQVLRRGRIRDYPMRDFMVRQGDRVSTLYILVTGRAHALVYSYDGQAVLLHEYLTGDFFGAIGAASESAMHEADVVAIEQVAAFLLDGAVLAMLAEQHGCIGMALLRVMVDRMQQTATRMFEHVALSAVGRVHAELLRQARARADLSIRPSPVLAELALRVSTTRETASRAVNALERRGIIRRDGDALIVVAPHRLEELIL